MIIGGNGTEGVYDADGNLQVDKIKALTRTYPIATQGIAKSLLYNRTTSSFTFEYTVDTTIKEGT